MLITSVSGDIAVPTNQRRLADLLTAKGVRYKEMDCSLEENREERNRLWGISGKRAVYPQVFIGDKFVGDLDAINVRAAPPFVVLHLRGTWHN